MPRRYSGHDDAFPPYVPVAQRLVRAAAETARLKKAGQAVEPVVLEGKAIAQTVWGKAWCKHLEAVGDFATRLPRGRSYLRHGAVLHLGIAKGRLSALVSGSEVYEVEVTIAPVAAPHWKRLQAGVGSRIDSVVELLSGKLSDAVMGVLSHPETGLFPKAREFQLSCTCPDDARLCKHVAAVLYGVGARFDARPELLFMLRGVDQAELVAEVGAGALDRGVSVTLARASLSDLFGIELAADGPGEPVAISPVAAIEVKGKAAPKRAPSRSRLPSRPLPSPLPQKGRGVPRRTKPSTKRSSP